MRVGKWMYARNDTKHLNFIHFIWFIWHYRKKYQKDFSKICSRYGLRFPNGLPPVDNQKSPRNYLRNGDQAPSTPYHRKRLPAIDYKKQFPVTQNKRPVEFIRESSWVHLRGWRTASKPVGGNLNKQTLRIMLGEHTYQKRCTMKNARLSKLADRFIPSIEELFTSSLKNEGFS